MNKNRPGSVNLATMVKLSWPITSLSSILHRVTGVLLFLAIPFFLWAIELSLSSQSGFNQIQQVLQGDVAKFISWTILSMLCYHMIAGARHLLMDAGIGESLEGGILGSKLVILAGILIAAGLGVWIW
ncbi:MAG: succinate dehydrogenase, cytochrome b556 subunit [Enterobacterales bacterium]|nr:succinate dehydrogenase, cytochrome b556 subunit [Enterobacterales bacterium]